MPALGMAQDTGRLTTWLKREGERVAKGEPLMEVETDKANVEIEAPAAGILQAVSAQEGEDVPVGQVIAWIVAPGENLVEEPVGPSAPPNNGLLDKKEEQPQLVSATPVARRIALEHGVNLSQVRASGSRIQKADVLNHLEKSLHRATRLSPASPKARRLAMEAGLDVTSLVGSGPQGAVLAEDVLEAIETSQPLFIETPQAVTPAGSQTPPAQAISTSQTWRIMTERVTQSWIQVPHFYLQREMNASQLIKWRERAQAQAEQKITITDLLILVVAAALRKHSRVNVTWQDGKVLQLDEINIGIAVAAKEGLVVPVIHKADELSLTQIAGASRDLVDKSNTGKLRLEDLQGGSLTISNLGMFGIDAFNAIINPPQSSILAVGRIAERVVPVSGAPTIQPMMVVTMSCDHRALDGAIGARFLDTLAHFIEEPLTLLN